MSVNSLQYKELATHLSVYISFHLSHPNMKLSVGLLTLSSQKLSVVTGLCCTVGAGLTVSYVHLYIFTFLVLLIRYKVISPTPKFLALKVCFLAGSASEK